MNLISRFDPWRSNLCTCPPKLTFDPYTGCDHACVYCYASSYIPDFSNCRPKKRLVRKLKREAAKLKGELVSIANSSDPYPNLEAEMCLTRRCLEILARHDCRIQLVTKSAIVARDIDLLEKASFMVTLTITTDDDCVSKTIEPYAPSSSERMRAARILVQKGVPISIRIDPIIPFVNDRPESLIEDLASIGVRHVTASTYKVKPDNWQRFRAALPRTAERLKPLYFEKGERIGRYRYLPKTVRIKLMEKMARTAKDYGLKFGTCREGAAYLNTASCDGSWLLNQRQHT